MRATIQLSVAAFTAALVVGAAAQTREPGPAPPNRGIITAEAPRTTPTNNKNAEDLERLSGQEFDAAFIEMMIAAHTEAIEKYGAQTHANPDRALADFASKSLSMLREHLAAAQSLRQ